MTRSQLSARGGVKQFCLILPCCCPPVDLSIGQASFWLCTWCTTQKPSISFPLPVRCLQQAKTQQLFNHPACADRSRSVHPLIEEYGYKVINKAKERGILLLNPHRSKEQWLKLVEQGSCQIFLVVMDRNAFSKKCKENLASVQGQENSTKKGKEQINGKEGNIML